MAPRPRESTKEKTAENRQRILDSAIDNFAEKGFDGANMRTIANQAGVNKYMLYYHFEDKKTLFEQVLDTITRPVFSKIMSDIESANDLESAIHSVYDVYGNLIGGRGGRLRAFLAREIAAGAPSIGPILRIKGPDLIRLWEPLICDYIGRDELPYQDIVRTVVSIMTTIITTFLTEPAIKNILDVYGLNIQDEDHREHVVRMILGGIVETFAHHTTTSIEET